MPVTVADLGSEEGGGRRGKLFSGLFKEFDQKNRGHAPLRHPLPCIRVR